MEPMIDKTHLQKRGSTWHYYRRVPKHLVPQLGRVFIKKSLGTPDLKRAQRLRTIEDLRVDALFAALEKGVAFPADGGGSTTRSVSLDILVEHIRGIVVKSDERHARQLALDPPADQEDLRNRRDSADQELGILLNPSDPRRDEWVAQETDRLLAKMGVSLSNPEEEAQFAEIVRQGLVELQRRKLGRYDDCHDRPFYNTLFDPKRPAAVSFGELAETFLAEKEQDYSLNGVSRKRLHMLRANVAVLQEAIGEGIPIHAVDDDMVQNVRSLLARMPSNRQKLYPDLCLQDAIKRGEKEGKETLSPVTQSRYLDILRDILKVAVRKKFLPHNPAAEVRPLVKDTVSAEDKRLPWTDEQLKGFFQGKFYHSCTPDASVPYIKPDC